MLARSFLIRSSSNLLVTRTGIKAPLSLISGLNDENFTLSNSEYLWGQLASLDQILFIASLGVGKGCIVFWGRLDQNSGVHGNRKPPLTYNGENGVSTFSRLLLIRSFLYLQVTRTCIKSRTGLNFSQIRLLTVSILFLIESSSKLLLTRTGIKAQSSLIFGWIRILILELLALEWRKFHTFELEYLWSQLVNLDQILCVASLGWGERLRKVLG